MRGGAGGYVILVLGLLVLSQTSCSVFASPKQDSPTMTPASIPTASNSEIEKWGRLTVPSSAQDMQAYVNTGSIDALVVLTFRIPAADLASFMDGAAYTAPLQPVGEELHEAAYFLGFSENLAGWPSDADWERLLKDPTRILMGLGEDEPGFHRSILVDQTDPELYTIYLVHFETY